jgi:hypothetical protein
MQAQYVADRSSRTCTNATSESQASALHLAACQYAGAWAMLHAGRTQAALTSHKGRGGNGCALFLIEEPRSRGCRRAPRSFLHWALWRLPQHARPSRKKLYTWTNRQLRLNQPTPASTSNENGRATGAQPRPALFLWDARRSEAKHCTRQA